MRSQTISAASESQELLAGAVDPTGWLAGPIGSRARTGQPGSPATNIGASGVIASGAENRTGERQATDRRAGGAASPAARRVAAHADRAARRAARARHLRRVRGGADRQVWLAQDTAVTEPNAERAVGRTETDAGQGYRLGRWARLALTVTVLAAVTVIVVSLTVGSAPSALVDVTVTPGDTLWSIATQAAPDRDPRDVIDEIRELNNVSGAALPVGVVLRVPVAAE